MQVNLKNLLLFAAMTVATPLAFSAITPFASAVTPITSAVEPAKAPEVTSALESANVAEMSKAAESVKAVEMTNAVESAKVAEMTNAAESAKVAEMTNAAESVKAAEMTSAVEPVQTPELASAAEPVVDGKPEIWKKKRWEYAVNGYDTVAYFTQNAAVEGDDRFVSEYKNAKWRFSSQENLALFEADPDKYRPQYGGHCAYGLGKNGVLVHGDPERWTIVDGKLYLNLNKRIQGKWKKKNAFYIEHADKVWPRALTEEIEVDW